MAQAGYANSVASVLLYSSLIVHLSFCASTASVAVLHRKD